jgi:hypothetical protein
MRGRLRLSPFGFVAYVRRRAADIAHLAFEKPIADWRIRELFYYVRPNGLLDNDSWEEVGADVMDKLATGQLLAWGRRGKARPLQPIDMTFWPDARLTYSFLAADHDDDEHAVKNRILSPLEIYSDIRISKAQALRIWPRPHRGWIGLVARRKAG